MNIQSSTVTSTMVEINWDSLPSADENGIIRHYLVNVTEVQTGNMFQTTSPDESAVLDNLHPAYEYTFRIAAYTIGSGPYSTVFTITTLEDVPSSAPTGLSSAVQGSTSVLLSWSPPPAADQNGVITVYTVEVINTATSNKDVYMTSSNTFTVVSLDPYTTYECSVAANTSVGMGPFSAKLAFQTVEAVPTAPPEGVSVEAPSSTSLDIEWSAPPQGSQNGIIRSYVVRVYEVITSTTLTYNTTDESLTVGSLHPHYQYHVSVAAVTVGQGPFSDAATIQTPQDAPSGPPTVILVSSLSSTSLSISWSPPLLPHTNGIIQYYIVNVSVAESQANLQFETSSLSLTLNDLHPFYTHTVIVSAVTIAPGPFSNEFIQKLPPDAPSGPPQSISGSVVSSTSIQLSWSPPLSHQQNGLIQSYTILVFEQQTNTTIEKHQNFLQTTIVLNNLQPNYDYTLSVAAHTVALGPYGSVVIRTSEDAPAGPPQNLSTLITSSRSITLQWNPPRPDLQNGLIQHYSVQLVDAQTNQVLQYTSTQHSITISNLHPYYTYTCTVTAVTVAPGPAALVTFQLPQDIPTGPPLNVSTLALNATSLFVTWKAPQNDLQNGIITSYSVQLFEVETSSTQIVNSVTGLSVSVGGLHPNYMYRVQVAAVTTGTGPYSDISLVQLPVSSPSGSPTGVSGSSTSPYSITIAWTAPEPGLLNGAVTGYIINVTHSDTLVTTQYSSFTTSLVINNLEPYTTYICVVAAQTSAGNGPFSLLILIQTQETAPSGAPEHASGIPVGSTSIHLTWDPPSPQYQNGLIRQYLINISEPVSGYVNQTSTDQTQITIDNLVPHRTYTCYVAAVTIAVGPYTGAIMVATEIDVPGGPPLNLSSTVNSSSTATVQWSPPQADLQNGVIQFYSIQLVAAETGSMLQYTSTELSLTITDLHPYYTYTCTIAAVTVAPGPGEVIVFQMLEDVPTGSPLNVTTTSVDATALLVSWVAPSADQQNGIIRQYHINLTESETGVITYYTVQNSLQTTLTGLHPYYNYQVTVAAVTIGLGPYSTEATVQLPEAAPSVSPGNFISEVTSAPSAYLTWSPLAVNQYNGQFGGYRLTCSPQGGLTITVQVSGTSVTLAEVEANGHYTCMVCAFTTVGCGPVSVTYFSTFRDSPVGPPTVAVANVTATSALVNWAPPFDPENLIIGYVITYRLISTSLPLETPRPPVTTANIVGTSFTLRPLLESSEYRIMVYAVTLNGTSPGSDEIEVQTGQPDTFTPINFRCVPTSYSMLLCSWKSPVIPGFQVVGYRLSYKLADGFDYYPGYGVVMETTLASNTQQYAIDSLQPYGGYLVVLEANITTVPESPGSGSGAVLTPEMPTSPPEYTIRETSTVNTTLADIPAAMIRSLSIDIISPTSIQLSWLPPERVHWNGLIDGFVITATRLGPVEGGATKRQQPSVLTAQVQPQNNHRDPSLAAEPLQMETHVMQGLEEYYDYSIAVNVVNAAGTGPTHPPVVQSMPPAAPSGPPINIAATATSSAIVVTWSPPAPLEANGLIIGYTLQLTRVKFGARTETNPLSGSTQSFRINGLTPYEPIQVTVAARTDQGLGPYSINNTFFTSEAPSSPPQNIRTTTVDETSVTVFWTKPVSENGILREYQVIYTVYSNNDQTGDRGTTTQYTKTAGNDTFSLRLTDLQPGIYDIKVRARNGAGYGDNSSSALVIIQSTATSPSTRPPSTVDAQAGGINTVLVIPIVVVVVVLIIVILLSVLIIVCVITRRGRTSKKLDLTRGYEISGEIPENNQVEAVQSGRDIELTRSPAAVVENPYVGWEERSTALTSDMDDLKSQPLGDAPPETDLPSYAEVRRTDEPTAGDESDGEEQAEQAEQAEPGMEKKEEEKKTEKVGEELVLANKAADEEEEEAELTDL